MVALDGDNICLCHNVPVASHRIWVLAQQFTSAVAFQLVSRQLDDVNILERDNWDLGYGDEVTENVEKTCIDR